MAQHGFQDPKTTGPVWAHGICFGRVGAHGKQSRFFGVLQGHYLRTPAAAPTKALQSPLRNPSRKALCTDQPETLPNTPIFSRRFPEQVPCKPLQEEWAEPSDPKPRKEALGLGTERHSKNDRGYSYAPSYGASALQAPLQEARRGESRAFGNDQDDLEV